MKLNVEKLSGEDAWKDIIRIPHAFRKDIKGKHVERGTICRLVVGANSKWAIVHGLDSDEPVIKMDLNMRIALEVKKGVAYDFTLQRLGWLRRLWFPWRASDPTYRLPAQLSIIAFILGVLFGVFGIAVGLIPIYKDNNSATKYHSEETHIGPTPNAQGSK